jgi:phosphatidylglycerophosphate synthase
VRPTRTSLAASAVYAALGLSWVFASHPPGPVWLDAGWIVGVAALGAAVPGLANQVSLARVYLAAPALAYALDRDLGFLAVTVAVASLTDLVDGTVARRLAEPTTFGGGLDPVVDGVFLGAVGVGLAVGGAFPLWLGLVVVARYLVPAIAGGVLIALRRPVELRHTLTGQVSTSLILVLLGGIALLRGLGQDPGNFVTGAEIVIPIATAATFVHLGWAATRRVERADRG